MNDQIFIFDKKGSISGYLDIDIIILSYLNERQLFKIKRVNKYNNNLFDNERLWIIRLNRFFPEIKSLTNYPNLHELPNKYRNYYLSLFRSQQKNLDVIHYLLFEAHQKNEVIKKSKQSLDPLVYSYQKNEAIRYFEQILSHTEGDGEQFNFLFMNISKKNVKMLNYIPNTIDLNDYFDFDLINKMSLPSFKWVCKRKYINPYYIFGGYKEYSDLADGHDKLTIYCNYLTTEMMDEWIDYLEQCGTDDFSWKIFSYFYKYNIILTSDKNDIIILRWIIYVDFIIEKQPDQYDMLTHGTIEDNIYYLKDYNIKISENIADKFNDYKYHTPSIKTQNLILSLLDKK